jgi:hypothetical protein
MDCFCIISTVSPFFLADCFTALSVAIATNGRMIDEMERIWKKEIVAQIEMQLRNLLGGPKKISSVIVWCSGRYRNWVPP